jgi:hypothetical protein
MGRVIKCAKGIGGEPVGHAHANPFFDTREYEVEFTDGTVERYAMNVIAENMYAQVDNEGNMFQLLDEIMDHKKDDTAIDTANGTVTSANGNVKPKITTQGWQLLVLWKDKSTSWVKLKDLKESNPVELAEYAVANRIAEEPALKWWVSNTLLKRNRILSKVKKKYWWTTHKFGYGLHKKSKVLCWGTYYRYSSGDDVFKCCFKRDSVQIGFMLAVLNGLDVMACDLENAYLNAPCVEKIWFEGGIECGSDKGKVCVVVRALYGLKSAGASWRATLAQALRDICFVSTIADPDVWIRPAAREDGYDYYEMLLVYVDDVLAIAHEPKVLIDAIGEYYKVKPGSDKEPDIYLGANVEKVQMPDGTEVWATSPRDYVKNAIKTVEGLLAEDGEGYILKNKAKNPFPMNYQPKLDVSNELGPELSSRYLQLIGIARWVNELGRIDIHHEVSFLSQYQANPRVGHLEALHHVFAYMKSHLDIGRVAFDPKTPVVD